MQIHFIIHVLCCACCSRRFVYMSGVLLFAWASRICANTDLNTTTRTATITTITSAATKYIYKRRHASLSLYAFINSIKWHFIYVDTQTHRHTHSFDINAIRFYLLGVSIIISQSYWDLTINTYYIAFNSILNTTSTTNGSGEKLFSAHADTFKMDPQVVCVCCDLARSRVCLRVCECARKYMILVLVNERC